MQKTSKTSATIDTNSGNYIVKLDQDSFDAETLKLSLSGYFLDIIALSSEGWEENELYENNLDCSYPATDYILKEYDFEASFMDACNEKPSLCLAADSTAKESNAFHALWKASDLQPGAWLALNRPENFAIRLQEYTETLTDQAQGYIGDYNTDDAALNRDLLEAYDSSIEEMVRGWLYGDYRGDCNGILYDAKKRHGFESVDLSRHKGNTDFVTVEVSAEWIKESENMEDVDTVTVEDASRAVIECIAYGARSYVTKERKRKEALQVEHAKTKAWKDREEERATQERKQSLQAMKR